MSNIQFNQELRSWIDTLPSWKKNLSLDILTHGSCREEGVENALTEFLIDQGLKEAPAAEEIPAAVTTPDTSDLPAVTTLDTLALVTATAPVLAVASSAPKPLKLTSIHGFKSVSALRDGERIEVGPGLTVIYGANGAGKSSYVRLLNRAFSSRGDQEILHNVFGEPTGEPSCEFCFNSDGTEETVAFPADKDHQHLQRFSVFDGKSARVHLDQKNELLFVPGGFEFFTSLNEGLDNMTGMLRARIAERKPINPLAQIFERLSPVWRLVNGVSAVTTEDDIRNQVVKTDATVIDNLERLEQDIAKLRTSKVADQVKKLSTLSGNLNLLLEKLRKVNSALSLASVTKFIRARTQVQEKDKEAKETGTVRFADLGIKYAGTPQFKDFLISAAAFMKLRDKEDGCPYCDRPLEEKEETLKNAYDTFLSSTAEKELANSRRELVSGIKTLQDIYFPTLDATQTLFTQLQKDDSGKQLAANYAERIKEAIRFRDELLDQLDEKAGLCKPSDFAIDESEITTYRGVIAKEIEGLQKLDPAAEIVKKEAELSLLHDRIKLGEELDSLLTYLRELKWCDQASKLITQFATNSVTIKQKEFFNRYVTDDYLKTFEEECIKLNAQLRVEISQQGAKGKTIRDLKVGGVDPGRVLSEGEQRATALADFLTEIRVSGNCSGLVFDDPVNSLDHDRKHLIAKRIAEEANNRQAVVFTHDLVFVAKLKEAVEATQCELCCHWIEKDGNGPGAIHLNNSPVNESDYKRITIADGWWQKARQAKSPSERQDHLKKGFASLRTCYEAFIIYDMFAEVYTRFGERISPGRLHNVLVDTEIVNQIVDKSGVLSKYIEAHLHSDEFAGSKPTTDMLKAEIDAFTTMKSRMKRLRQERSSSK
jgi:energy-coupling factor transporter ATP-binding protein EcfA2